VFLRTYFHRNCRYNQWRQCCRRENTWYRQSSTAFSPPPYLSGKPLQSARRLRLVDDIWILVNPHHNHQNTLPLPLCHCCRCSLYRCTSRHPNTCRFGFQCCLHFDTLYRPLNSRHPPCRHTLRSPLWCRQPLPKFPALLAGNTTSPRIPCHSLRYRAVRVCCHRHRNSVFLRTYFHRNCRYNQWRQCCRRENTWYRQSSTAFSPPLFLSSKPLQSAHQLCLVDDIQILHIRWHNHRNTPPPSLGHRCKCFPCRCTWCHLSRYHLALQYAARFDT